MTQLLVFMTSGALGFFLDPMKISDISLVFALVVGIGHLLDITLLGGAGAPLRVP
jgi:hypothetical protein